MKGYIYCYKKEYPNATKYYIGQTINIKRRQKSF